jgi:predicted lipase
MKINSKNVQYYLDKAEDARLNYDPLKNKYGDLVEPFDIKETDTQGYILRVDDGIIISFRGSQQVPDWFTDFDGFQVVYPYDNPNSQIKVHKGFINAYKSARDVIHEAIKRIKPTTIVVCGHSLGGALSTLCAVDIQYNFPEISLFCYTSGQPKVGNKAFMESFNKRVPNMIRTYMRKDIVPLCPPDWLEKLADGKYYHVGIPNPIGPRVFLFGILSWMFRINKEKLIENLTNHSMSLYKKFA